VLVELAIPWNLIVDNFILSLIIQNCVFDILGREIVFNKFQCQTVLINYLRPCCFTLWIADLFLGHNELRVSFDLSSQSPFLEINTINNDEKITTVVDRSE
jgi:hypothetical protein